MTASKKLIQASAGNVAGGDFYPYTIDNSARFNDNDSPKLLRTQTAGNRKIATFSFWVKRSTLGGTQHIITGGYDDGTAVSDSAPLRFRSDDKIEFLEYINGYIFHVISNAVFRDTSAWYHFVWVMDTTQTTSSNRIKLYVNGVQQSFSSASYPSQNYDTNYNASGEQTQIGYQGQTPSSNDRSYFDGYMAEFYYIDGTAYDASAFGEDKNGVWIPKSPSVTFGTNGFYLDFADSANLGNDVSGNGNDFTVNGLTSSDQMIDTPTNNFNVLNPISNGAGAISDGNLHQVGIGTATHRTNSTMSVSSGKWYFEAALTTASTFTTIGFGQDNLTAIYPGYDSLSYAQTLEYATSINNNVQPSYGTALSSGDIFMCALDLDAGEIYFGKNGTWFNSSNPSTNTSPAYSSLPAGDYQVIARPYNVGAVVDYNFGQNGSFNGTKTAQGNSDANGIGDFYYSVPTDYLALCTANLPEPTIGANSTIKPEDCFATVLYTGNGTAIGSGGKAVTGVGFQPDMVWIKNRDAADSWMCFDSVRGATKYLSLDDDGNEVTDTETLTSFDADGFTLGNNVAVNTSGEDYVAYCFKITAGFFDIVSYTGTGITHTEAHSLGVVPNLLIPKNLSTTSRSWNIYCSSLPVADPETDFLKIDTNAAVADSNTLWNDTAPTSSVFTVGTNNSCNQSGDSFICYLFADVEGFCKTGYYKGNGNVDGPFEYLGFSPQLHVYKRTDVAKSWVNILEVINPINDGSQEYLMFDNINPQAQFVLLDQLSNGIKYRTIATATNASGGDYITLSIGGNSIKYSNAR